MYNIFTNIAPLSKIGLIRPKVSVVRLVCFCVCVCV